MSRVISNVRIPVRNPRRRSRVRRAVIAALIPVTALAVANVAPSGEADAARPPCHDSNGSRPGGSVYVIDGHALGCDVSPPQRLHVTRVPSRSACDDMGGRYSVASRICWDVDY